MNEYRTCASGDTPLTQLRSRAVRVTLAGIKRRGLVDWKGREDWIGRKVRIWSREHCAWWRPEAKGYTHNEAEAWVVDFPTAYDYTKHCGPEKQIVYYAALAKLTGSAIQ